VAAAKVAAATGQRCRSRCWQKQRRRRRWRRRHKRRRRGRGGSCEGGGDGECERDGGEREAHERPQREARERPLRARVWAQRASSPPSPVRDPTPGSKGGAEPRLLPRSSPGCGQPTLQPRHQRIHASPAALQPGTPHDSVRRPRSVNLNYVREFDQVAPLSDSGRTAKAHTY